MVWLLAAAVFINYFDRGNLATASPLLQGELALSNSELGVLFSAFFWSYAPLQPVAGWPAPALQAQSLNAVVIHPQFAQNHQWSRHLSGHSDRR